VGEKASGSNPTHRRPFTFPVAASSGGIVFIDAVRGCSGLTSDAKKLHNAGRRGFVVLTIEELLATCSSLAE